MPVIFQHVREGEPGPGVLPGPRRALVSHSALRRHGQDPAGVTAGQQIRLKGQGETAPGHPPGDLLITISIAPHAFFKVDGSDLRVDLPITLYEAVLGGKIRVPTLGSAVELSIPKNTSSGRTFRLKGKGLPKTGGSGDLFVTTRIMLPDGNDAELEALMQKWRDGHPYNPRSDL